jgi:hypothetical protein
VNKYVLIPQVNVNGEYVRLENDYHEFESKNDDTAFILAFKYKVENNLEGFTLLNNNNIVADINR